jgi:hypothetical protein
VISTHIQCIKMRRLAFCTLTFIIIWLSIIKDKSNAYEINEYAIKRIDAATKVADQKYDVDHTMNPPEVRYDIFPSLDETWKNDAKSYCVLPYILFDPLCQFNAFLDGNVVTCPKCKGDDKMSKTNTPGHLSQYENLEKWAVTKTKSSCHIWSHFSRYTGIQTVLL